MNLYYVPIHSNPFATFQLALLDAATCASKKSSDARFAVDGVANIPSHLEKAVTGNVSRELKKNGTATINGVAFGLQTERTQNSRAPIVFAPYVTIKFLTNLFSDGSVSELFYVPYTEQELEVFLSEHPEAQSLVPVEPPPSEA